MTSLNVSPLVRRTPGQEKLPSLMNVLQRCKKKDLFSWNPFHGRPTEAKDSSYLISRVLRADIYCPFFNYNKWWYFSHSKSPAKSVLRRRTFFLFLLLLCICTWVRLEMREFRAWEGQLSRNKEKQHGKSGGIFHFRLISVLEQISSLCKKRWKEKE